MLKYQRVHVNMHINVWCQDPWLLFIDKLPVPSTEEFHRQFQMRGSKHRDTVAWCSCCKAYLRIEYINTKWTGLLQPTIYTSIYLGMWFPQNSSNFPRGIWGETCLWGSVFCIKIQDADHSQKLVDHPSHLVDQNHPHPAFPLFIPRSDGSDVST